MRQFAQANWWPEKGAAKQSSSPTTYVIGSSASPRLQRNLLARARPGIEPTLTMHWPGEDKKTAARHAEIQRRYAWQAEENRRKTSRRHIGLTNTRDKHAVGLPRVRLIPDDGERRR